MVVCVMVLIGTFSSFQFTLLVKMLKADEEGKKY